MFEDEDVTSRPDLLPQLSTSDVGGFLDWLASASSHDKVYFLWRPLLKDPKDDMALEASASSKA